MSTHCQSIDQAQDIIRSLCHRHDLEPVAMAHLQRALSHLNEAWISSNGSKAQTVEEVTKACEGVERFSSKLKMEESKER